jgi:hypothetical protein
MVRFESRRHSEVGEKATALLTAKNDGPQQCLQENGNLIIFTVITSSIMSEDTPDDSGAAHECSVNDRHMTGPFLLCI